MYAVTTVAAGAGLRGDQQAPLYPAADGTKAYTQQFGHVLALDQQREFFDS
jgi:hypothetical protein